MENVPPRFTPYKRTVSRLAKASGPIFSLVLLQTNADSPGLNWRRVILLERCYLATLVRISSGPVEAQQRSGLSVICSHRIMAMFGLLPSYWVAEPLW